MPDLDIIVSQMPSAVQDNSSDFVMLTQPNAQAETGYSTAKETLENIAKKSVHGIEYETLLANFPSGKRNPTDALNVLNDFIQSQLPVNSASGSIANFSTSLALPLVAMSAEIVAQQASGTPTPSNPLPITGVSSINLYKRGVNLWDEEWEVGDLDGTGQPKEATNRIRSKNFIPVAPNTAYRFPDTVNIHIFFYDISQNYISTGGYSAVVPTQTTPANCFYIKFRAVTTYGTTYNNDIFVNYPSTDTQYHAYNSQSETKTIALGQTIYGGSVDCIGGTGMKTVKYFSFSEAQYYGTYGADNANLYYVEIPNYDTERIKTYASSAFPDCILISNMFVKNTSSASGMLNNQIRTNTGAAPQYFYFRADEFADLNALNEFLANTPLQVVAELQTPQDITGLTGVNFETSEGEQNIFANCGDISVSFKQGIQEYIDAKIAETQALIL